MIYLTHREAKEAEHRMFTVKLIDPFFQEELIEAKSVSLVNKEMGYAGTGVPQAKELRISHDGGVTIVDSGQVYVMNANGKTVADYLFSMPPTNEVVGYRK